MPRRNPALSRSPVQSPDAVAQPAAPAAAPAASAAQETSTSQYVLATSVARLEDKIDLLATQIQLVQQRLSMLEYWAKPVLPIPRPWPYCPTPFPGPRFDPPTDWRPHWLPNVWCDGQNQQGKLGGSFS